MKPQKINFKAIIKNRMTNAVFVELPFSVEELFGVS